MTKKDKDIKRLIKHIAKEDVVLFLGSGFSLKAGAPSVYNLKRLITEEGGTDFAEDIDIDKISLAQLSEEFVKFNGNSRHELISVLQRAFEITPNENGLSDHKYLRLIPHFSKIYTTNYETFIEAAYPQEELQVVNSNQASVFEGNKPVTLYKIHGDLSTLHSPDSVVITESDYKEYFKGKKFEMLWNQFKIDAKNHNVLFIGYSLEDPNILKIIKELHKLIGNSIKEMFLVAPNMSDINKGKLKRLVTYIDAKAEEILPLIHSSLMDSICDDYKSKHIKKTETYSRFCELNGEFQPVCKVGNKENSIERFDPMNGKPFHHELKLTFPSQYDYRNPAAYNSFIPYSKTNIRIPAISIPRQSVSSFKYMLNGINIANIFKTNKFFISPSTEDLEVEIKQPSIRFKEKVKGCRYRDPQDNNIHVQLSTPLFVMHFIMHEENSVFIEMGIIYNETFKDLSVALKWNLFLIETFTQKTFLFNGVKVGFINVTDSAIEELHKMKLYYEALQMIEFDHDVRFTEYNKYSDYGYSHALIALSYLKKVRIELPIPMSGELELCVDEERFGTGVDTFVSNEMKLAYASELGKFTLCGVEFNVPYLCTIINRISFRLGKQCEEHKYTICSNNITHCDSLFATDKSPYESKDDPEGLGVYMKKIKDE